MRLVVTGALGHIGSRLIRDLPFEFPGCELVLVDNLATERYGSLFDLPREGHYEFVEADVLDANLHRLFEGADAVVHLAALTNVARTDLRERMQRVNVDGTDRVAQACLETRTPLLFPSTTSVYGMANGVVDEDCRQTELRPQSPYAEWKLRSENQLRAMSRDGLRFVIVRMGSIFGPSVGMRFHTAVNQFCWRAMVGQPIEVWKTAPHQFRPYLDLLDAVRAMMFIVRRRHFDGRVYNVVTLNATVTDVVEVLTAFVPGLQITHVESPLMNTLSYCVENRRFRELGFEFSGNLERGIGDTVAMIARRQRSALSQR